MIYPRMNDPGDSPSIRLSGRSDVMRHAIRHISDAYRIASKRLQVTAEAHSEAGLDHIPALQDRVPGRRSHPSRSAEPRRGCQVCHRPGEAGPFSLVTFEDARPRATAIKKAVVAGKMPPWFADPHYGTFSNSMSLSASEIDTIVKWVDGGAPEGDQRDLPKPAEWVEGWGIGTPDMVFELPLPFEVPARGVVEYQHVIVPTNFTEDRWIQAAEIRPTAREVVHHLIAYVREPKSKWFRGQPAGVFFTAPKVSTDEETEAGALPSDFLVGYAPGQPAEILRPGQGKLIKAGSDIVF
jgi:hypothetical protein